MTFSSIVRLEDGSYLGQFHRFKSPVNDDHYQIMQSITRDGGLTWSQPTVAFDSETMERKKPCEPYVFRSPAGDEWCCIMRENWRSGTSLMLFSRDEPVIIPKIRRISRCGKTDSKQGSAWNAHKKSGISLPENPAILFSCLRSYLGRLLIKIWNPRSVRQR